MGTKQEPRGQWLIKRGSPRGTIITVQASAPSSIVIFCLVTSSRIVIALDVNCISKVTIARYSTPTVI